MFNQLFMPEDERIPVVGIRFPQAIDNTLFDRTLAIRFVHKYLGALDRHLPDRRRYYPLGNFPRFNPAHCDYPLYKEMTSGLFQQFFKKSNKTKMNTEEKKEQQKGQDDHKTRQESIKKFMRLACPLDGFRKLACPLDIVLLDKNKKKIGSALELGPDDALIAVVECEILSLQYDIVLWDCDYLQDNGRASGDTVEQIKNFENGWLSFGDTDNQTIHVSGRREQWPSHLVYEISGELAYHIHNNKFLSKTNIHRHCEIVTRYSNFIIAHILEIADEFPKLNYNGSYFCQGCFF